MPKPNKYRKEPAPPTTRSGRSKRDRMMQKHGDYEPVLMTRVGAFQGLPLQAVAVPPRERRLDPMGPKTRFFTRKHYQTVIYALDTVVATEAAEIRGQNLDALLTRNSRLGLSGATKLKSMRLMEKIQKKRQAWWLSLDKWAEHIAVLDQVGHEVLVEWLRTYKP